jgi:hypothetical protein
MKASFQGQGKSPKNQVVDQQKNLFVDDAEIQVAKDGDKPLNDRKCDIVLICF